MIFRIQFRLIFEVNFELFSKLSLREFERNFEVDFRRVFELTSKLFSKSISELIPEVQIIRKDTDRSFVILISSLFSRPRPLAACLTLQANTIFDSSQICGFVVVVIGYVKMTELMILTFANAQMLNDAFRQRSENDKQNNIHPIAQLTDTVFYNAEHITNSPFLN